MGIERIYSNIGLGMPYTPAFFVDASQDRERGVMVSAAINCNPFDCGWFSNTGVVDVLRKGW